MVELRVTAFEFKCSISVMMVCGWGGVVEVRVWGVGGPKTNVHCAHVPCKSSQLHYAQQG